MLIPSKFRLATPIAATIFALFATGASATQILGYAQSGETDQVTATTNGSGVTTVSVDDGAIVVANYAGTTADPFGAFLTLTAVSTDEAVLTGGVGGTITQHYTGSFCITSAINCGGTNYLSGTFVDEFSGTDGGGSAGLNATTPPAAGVAFTADPGQLTAAQLGEQRAMSFSFSNVKNAALSICSEGGNDTVCAFTASHSGTFSANIGQQDTPEPATLALLGIALAGLGFSRRRKQA